MPFVESADIGMTEARDAESNLHNAGTYDAHVMWRDSSVIYGTRSAEQSYLTVRVGERSTSYAVGDTIRLALGDTATIEAQIYDDAGRLRDASALWWHDTADGPLRFLQPTTGGRYAADPARVIAVTAGSNEVMLHWAGTAGGAVFVAFRVDGP